MARADRVTAGQLAAARLKFAVGGGGEVVPAGFELGEALGFE
jgi:hypothetical protein